MSTSLSGGSCCFHSGWSFLFFPADHSTPRLEFNIMRKTKYSLFLFPKPSLPYLLQSWPSYRTVFKEWLVPPTFFALVLASFGLLLSDGIAMMALVNLRHFFHFYYFVYWKYMSWGRGGGGEIDGKTDRSVEKASASVCVCVAALVSLRSSLEINATGLPGRPVAARLLLNFLRDWGISSLLFIFFPLFIWSLLLLLLLFSWGGLALSAHTLRSSSLSILHCRSVFCVRCSCSADFLAWWWRYRRGYRTDHHGLASALAFWLLAD